MRVREKIYILLLAASGLVSLAMFAAEHLTGQRVVTRIGRMQPYDFLYIFLCLISAGVIYLLIHCWRKVARKLTKALIVLGWIGTVGVFLLGSFIWLLNHGVTTWYEFDSPDHKYSLVAGESTVLLLSEIRLYERTSPFLVRELEADLLPDDGFAAITQGAYQISWEGDVVTLSADMNMNGLWDTVELDMADHGKVLAKSESFPNGKPAWMEEQSDADKEEKPSPASDASEQKEAEQRAAEQRAAEQKIYDGLRAVAKATGKETVTEPKITYTAKGTPKLVLSSNPEIYLLYDRDSANSKCALYVLYQSEEDAEGDSDPQIVDMYAYDYSSGKVITACRHDWSDAGTDEYREATGE